MKKQFLLKSLMLLCMLFVGMGAWADSSTWTFSSCATTASNKPVNTLLNATVVPASETGKWTASCSANSYANTLNGGGVQLGSSNYKFNGTISLSETNIPAAAKITSIVVNGKSGGTYTLTCKVNGVNYGSAQTVTGSTATDYTFSGNATGNNIELTASTSVNKYIGIVSITINYTLEQATITLSEVGNESNVAGTHYAGDQYTLPSTSSYACGTKSLVGWSTVEVEETDTKPTSNYYAKGETIELNGGNNVFYAVYANITPGGQEDATLSISYSQNSAPSGWTINDRGWNTGYWGLANGENYNIISPEIDDLSTIKSIKVNTRTYGTTSGKSNVLEVYSGSTTYGTQTATGTMTNYTISKTNTLTGSGSVCFKSQGTVDGSGLRVTDIVIEYTVDGTLYSGYTTYAPVETATIDITTPEGYSTFVCDDAIVMPEGVEGSTATVAGGELTLAWEYQAGAVVPAGTPILVKGTEGEHTATITTGGTAPVTNYLVANTTGSAEWASIICNDDDDVNKYYVLTYGTGANASKLGFYWYEEEGSGYFDVPVGKVFLCVPAGVLAKAAFFFGGETDGINSVERVKADNAIYNLAGQRVNANTKGIVIANGKKYVVK